MTPLRATYRLQFNRDFTFADAAQLVPYLQRLGISHCYASPFLKARPGSSHGYDIVDHNALNPELGSPDQFEAYRDALHRHGMGQILDLVANHMGIGADNPWWWDLLAHGQASPYADWFDIDWQPQREALRGKVLLPVLEEHYGRVLEAGLLQPGFDPARGGFLITYRDQRFPLAPASTAPLLRATATLLRRWGHGAAADCAALSRAFAAQASTGEMPGSADRALQQRLADLHREQPALGAAIDLILERYRGQAGETASFDRLHRLLEAQHYRLAHWLVASDEINYRRFFNVNDLAGLRMENPAVFDATHRLVLRLAAEGAIQGLRIDHPDGLLDPTAYLRRLRGALAEALGESAGNFHLFTEKILGPDERLPAAWPVDGTTGYEFARDVSGLLIQPEAETRLNRIYARFAGANRDFAEQLHQCKHLVMRLLLNGELTMLANRLDRIAQADRRTRDFTRERLREALTEVVAALPIYRTYVSADGITETDRQRIEQALAAARRRWPRTDPGIYDFLQAILLDNADGRRLDFTLRFQQYTAPVMAKALEDTLLYRHVRLLALNEVGSAHDRFGISVVEFHQANLRRRQHHPHSLLSTDTHDSKRSEDLRARLLVLSEMPERWHRHLLRWVRLNRHKKPRLQGVAVPDRNTEYFLYQTLLGVWPLGAEAADEPLHARLETYLLKALREAKQHTSWSHPDPAYEEAAQQFLRRLLAPAQHNAFLTDFLELQRRIAPFGLYNSLSQTLLKLTVPGVPDIYQGSELWRFELVDPDNRQPVDFTRRQRMLKALEQGFEAPYPERGRRLRALLDTLEDGRAKLFLTWQLLQLRRRHPALFSAGDYLPLTAEGERAEQLCAFARHHRTQWAIVLAPRGFVRLQGESNGPPLGTTAWGETRLRLPPAAAEHTFVELLSGRPVLPRNGTLALAEVLAHFPQALLVSDARS